MQRLALGLSRGLGEGRGEYLKGVNMRSKAPVEITRAAGRIRLESGPDTR